MKKNRKWLRITALVLAMACLVSAVFAATFDASLDLSGDNKINVWDIQLAVNDGKTEDAQKILTGALGSPDELNPVSENTYEIYSALGLYNMVKNADKGYTFVLKADIDLNGADWIPAAKFNGTFNGNGKTISNVKITKGATAEAENLGFFGQVNAGSSVMDLNLRNVSITATAKANYMGLVAGSNRGSITNVTATGIITDTRTEKPGAYNLCYGALVGGCSVDGGEVKYTLTGGTGLTVTDSQGNKTEGLCADVKFVISADDSIVNKEGVAGWAPDYTEVSGTYCDSSNATTLLSETERTRRKTVVDRMYQMGTVKWTPSTTFTFTRSESSGSGTLAPGHTHSNVYEAGEVYTGIPYVGGEPGSYERFLSQMKAAKTTINGVECYQTLDNLKDGTRINITGEPTTISGHVEYIGSNCSYAVQWAWAAISPSRVANDDGAIYGGAHIYSATGVVPTASNQAASGALPVGGYEVPESYASGLSTRDTASLIAHVTEQGMAEAYAQTHMGDAITYAEYYLDSEGVNQTTNSHIRLVAADPVIIRNSDGSIDLEKSYVLTHEQGDGLNDNRDENGNKVKYTDPDTGYIYYKKHTSWRINHKYTLSVLLTKTGYDNAIAAWTAANYKNGLHPGCGYGYVPITMRAFTLEEDKAWYSTEFNGWNDTWTDEQKQEKYHPFVQPNIG